MGHLEGSFGAMSYHSVITQALNGYHTQNSQFLNSSKLTGITGICKVRNATSITKLFQLLIRAF